LKYIYLTEKRTTMKHKAIRIILLVIEAIIGLGAIGGGIAILAGAFNQWFPLAWLQGTPFNDYTIPGLILLIVIGGGMVLAAATILIQREWSVLLSAAMGLVMIGFEIFEIAIIDRYPDATVPSSLSQQAIMSILGLVIFGLASYLWISEYRQHHFPTSPVSQS
jgi:hypothetical protein